MMDDYPETLRRVEKVQDAIKEKKGAEKQIKKRIRKEFGCKTIKEAERKNKSLLKEEHVLMDRYITRSKRFKKQWQKILDRYS